MDLKALMDGPDERWTEERHSHFLNWIEASFVRRMIRAHFPGGGGSVPCRCTDMYEGTRLDRFVPDSATESTEDSMRRPRPRPPPSAAAATLESEPQCASTFSIENTKKRTFSHLKASLQTDQVVPEIKNNKDGDAVFIKRKHRRRGGF